MLFGAVVAAQIAYPLVGGTARDRLTVATVVLTFAAVAAHATLRFGLRTAVALLGTVLVVAATAETLGVHTGVPFGSYAYGPGLGPRLAGVPLVVPAAWAMTGYPALLVARRLTADLTVRQWATPLVGGWALASWDVFLDPQMVHEGYWRWAHPHPALPGSPGVPLTNYAGWLVVSVALLALLDRVAPGPTSPPPSGDKAVHGVSPLELTHPQDGGELMPGVLYVWTYAAQVLANLAFFGRPAVALLGGVAMGVIAVPYARTLGAGRPAARWASAAR